MTFKQSGIFLIALIAALPAFAQDNSVTTMQQLFVVKQTFPQIKAIGVLCNTQYAAAFLKDLKVAGTAYMITITVYNVQDLQNMRESYDKLMANKVDMIWLIPDGTADQKFGRRFLSEKCIAAKIPLYTSSLDYLREGALFCVAKDSTGAVKGYFNKKVSGMMGLTFPADIADKLIAID
jgi:ABC-type uncharacterized transport system substrate-binding protein